MSEIRIENGTKTYDIMNKSGKMLGQITFNPSDVSIMARHAEVMKQLRALELAWSKKSKKMSVSQEIEELDKIVYEKVDYIFNADVSGVLFSIMGPFSPMENGQFFVEYILEVLGKVIQDETGAYTQKITNKIQKHTAKYHN